jgi:hypothetical protein
VREADGRCWLITKLIGSCSLEVASGTDPSVRCGGVDGGFPYPKHLCGGPCSAVPKVPLYVEEMDGKSIGVTPPSLCEFLLPLLLSTLTTVLFTS